MAEAISVQMNKILEEYKDRVENVADVAINRVARECVKRLRQTSPKRTGSYARGWALKKLKGRGSSGITDVIVHNKTDYQLTHLLENGHAIVNAKGEWGRTNGIKHIAPVEEWANEELPNEIERELE